MYLTYSRVTIVTNLKKSVRLFLAANQIAESAATVQSGWIYLCVEDALFFCLQYQTMHETDQHCVRN